MIVTNPFKKLGIAPHSTIDVIKSAYRTLAKQCHPDLRPDKDAAAIEFRELTRIYEAALLNAGTVPKQKTRKKESPPPKPIEPIKHRDRVPPIDDFEFDMFGEATRFAMAPAAMFEYGGTMIIDMEHLGSYGMKVGSFQFEVPPKTVVGQRFRFKFDVGTVEITLVKGRR